ncbi:Hypothetical predicted protein [Cloeon dipterum]|uniref:Fibronectin type-III domain-containing protein n=1 Tax=Cloeon dipterum TaxID=197152 RepID=A0A8S1D6V0_9INSE|nr:Hypothetical predicted protein [Cloeon dipterum]
MLCIPDARSGSAQEEPEDDIRLVMEDELERKSDAAYDGSEGGDENKAPSEDPELDECREREFIDDLQENNDKSDASDTTLVEEDVNAVDREKNGDENSNPPSEAVISISSTPIDIADSTNNFDCADEEPEDSPRKRPASTTDEEVAVKKIKIETSNQSAEMSVQEGAELVKTMTRDELAKLFIDEFISSTTRKSEMAIMEQELVKLKLKCDSYKKKITTLTKQCLDIQNSVAQVAESNKSAAKALKPKPIVRHVAVQVPSKNIGTTTQLEKKVKVITPLNRVPLPPQQPNTIITKASPKPAAVKSPQVMPTVKTAGRQVMLTKTTPSGAVVTTSPASQGMVPPLRLTSKSTTPPNPPVRTIGQTTMRNGQTTMKGSDAAASMQQFMQNGNRIIIPNSTGLPGMQQTKQPVAYLISNSNNGNMLLQSQVGGILLNKASPTAVNPVQMQTSRNNNVLGNRPFMPQTAQNSTTMRQPFTNGTRRFSQALRPPTHPAPLPSVPFIPPRPGWKQPPPKPNLKIQQATKGGIMLSWNLLTFNSDHEEIKSYQIYAYQETSEEPSQRLWKTVGDVKALALPMACTLTQFKDGYKYHFAVRAVDIRNRMGPSSDTMSIELRPPNH